jgi:hypothetical protein
MKSFLSILTSLTLLLCFSFTGRTATSPDTIKIISVTPAQSVIRGVENEFTVEVEYNLVSEEEGEINLGFNSEKPQAFKMVDSYIVKKGSGTATLKAKVIPVDWGQRGKFMALVNLSKYPHDFRWNPITRDKQDITVGQ